MEEEEEKIPCVKAAPTVNYNHDLPKQGTGTTDHQTLLGLF